MTAGAHLLSRWTGSTSITLSNNGETRAGCYGEKNHLDFILVLWTIHNLNSVCCAFCYVRNVGKNNFKWFPLFSKPKYIRSK